jgi:hypothetical protein
MNISGNGRVVVIDDVEGEAIPLIKVLWMNNIPVSFFSGRKKELPKNLLTGIRLVFLDLELVTTTEKKTIKSTLQRVLNSIISPANGPYILLLWSVHEHDYTSVLQELFNAELSALKPVITLTIEKTTYLKTEDNGEKKFVPNALNLIERRLKKELKKIGAFHFFYLWEDLVHSASGQTVNSLSSFYQTNKNWNKNISSLVVEFAKAHAGENLDPKNTKEIIKNAYFAFNGTFEDFLINNIRHCKDLKRICLDSSLIEVGPELRANVNSRLLLDTKPGFCCPEPGNVYTNRIKNISKVRISDIFCGGQDKLNSFQGKTKLLEAIKHILIEISPLCDYAYASKKLRTNRVLPGILWPVEFEKKIRKKAEYLYLSQGPFQIEGHQYRIVLDLRCFASLPLSVLKKKKKPRFKIRQELLSDIQNHVARHINRFGVTSL